MKQCRMRGRGSQIQLALKRLPSKSIWLEKAWWSEDGYARYGRWQAATADRRRFGFDTGSEAKLMRCQFFCLVWSDESPGIVAA